MSADRLSALEALRDTLRDSILEAPVDKRAPLASQYRATLSEIDELASSLAGEMPKGTPLDELARRRAQRSAGA